MAESFYASSALFVVEENNTFYLVANDPDRSKKLHVKIRGDQTDKFVSNQSPAILEYIIEDLDRCGELTLKKDHSLGFNETFCAYAFYSQLEKFLSLNDQESEHQSIVWSLMNDKSLIQTANGPPLETEQMRRLLPIREAAANLFEEEEFADLTNVAWGTYYINSGFGDVPDSRESLNEMIENETWDGPGRVTTNERFSRTTTAKKAIGLYESLTPIEQGSIWTIWKILGDQSWLIPYLFVTKQIRPSVFAAASLGLGHYIFSLDNFFEETPPGTHADGFDTFEKVAVVANNILELSKGDRFSEIQELLKTGENQSCEFKQTYSWDIKEKKKADYLIESSLKTVVGFINAKGGSLVVGVGDNGELTGLEEEIEKLDKGSSDKFLLRLKNNFESKIGIKYQSFYEYDLIDMGGGISVLLVTCIPGTSACYLNGKDFYLRTNPATNKLEGPDLVDYCKQRFN